MIIAIDGSRAFLRQRTGIEEYSFQTIKHLRDKFDQKDQVVLFLRKGQLEELKRQNFDLPKNWIAKEIWMPRFWTQLGLSFEMARGKFDTLFVPAHTVPLIHPKNTVVVVHGLEYEFLPGAYSLWERWYMRISIKNSCVWAKKIICVSENTKKDLMELYKIGAEKISVVYEGYSEVKSQKSIKSKVHKVESLRGEKYLLFVGRIEERKNVIGMIEAFEILKEKHNVPHKLILAGRGGFGFEKIKKRAYSSKFQEDIVFSGFVSEEEKWSLLEGADVFLFPTYYEGFGIPVLEAQSVGTPVIASDNSSIPEVIGDDLKKFLVNPDDSNDIAEKTWNFIDDKKLRKNVSEKGLLNVKRFSWEKCSQQIADAINN
ncbi:MAG: glycosyltransferase family 4 protein [Candidatus Moranbacteria bacterium]|nr:glycosyltransferase family 4 protein [Candidatus Moranbacteria bacterium]